MKKYRALMSFAEDSHVRTFLVPEKEQESMPKGAASGGKCSGPFAWYDQSTCLWRTWQRCLTGGLMKFLGRWPKAGMMRNGRCYELPNSACLIEEKDSFLLPTMRASLGEKGVCFARVESTEHRSNLEDFLAVKMSLKREDGPYKMNPRFCEALMSFPIGWTDLEHSEMP